MPDSEGAKQRLGKTRLCSARSGMPSSSVAMQRAVVLGYFRLPQKSNPLTMVHLRTRSLAPGNPLGHNPNWLASTRAMAYPSGSRPYAGGMTGACVPEFRRAMSGNLRGVVYAGSTVTATLNATSK